MGRSLLLLLVTVLIAGCTSVASTPTQIPIAASTPLPTKPAIRRTATPSPTPIPTNTPIPTDTPKPTPTEVPCSIQSVSYLEDLDSLFVRWDDAAELADNTPRINLAGPIGSLQGIHQEAMLLNVPECAAGIHNQLDLYMDGIIDGFLSFQADDGEGTVDFKFRNAFLMYDLFNEYLDSIDFLDSLQPRIFLLGQGFGMDLNVTYDNEDGKQIDEQVDNPWRYELPYEAKQTYSLAVRGIDPIPAFIYTCAIFVESELVSYNEDDYTGRARCSYRTP